MFQSTRPRGRTRPVPPCNSLFRFCVSIHASSREDATTEIGYTMSIRGFNPRVLAGGRDSSPMFARVPIVFQSTRPRGRTRPINLCIWIPNISFNPRVLAGGRDMFSGLEGVVFSLFQSTRPRGRTRRLERLLDTPCRVSIHASSREDATHHPVKFLTLF